MNKGQVGAKDRGERRVLWLVSFSPTAAGWLGWVWLLKRTLLKSPSAHHSPPPVRSSASQKAWLNFSAHNVSHHLPDLQTTPPPPLCRRGTT